MKNIVIHVIDRLYGYVLTIQGYNDTATIRFTMYLMDNLISRFF